MNSVTYIDVTNLVLHWMLHQFPASKGTEPASIYTFLCFLGASIEQNVLIRTAANSTMSSPNIAVFRTLVQAS